MARVRTHPDGGCPRSWLRAAAHNHKGQYPPRKCRLSLCHRPPRSVVDPIDSTPMDLLRAAPDSRRPMWGSAAQDSIQNRAADSPSPTFPYSDLPLPAFTPLSSTLSVVQQYHSWKHNLVVVLVLTSSTNWHRIQCRSRTGYGVPYVTCQHCPSSEMGP